MLKFVNMRVELDHQQRLLGSHSNIASLERPGSMLDGGYGAFGQVDLYAEEVEEDPEDAALRALLAVPDPTGELAPFLAMMKGRKQHKAKGGGGKGDRGRAPPQRLPGAGGGGRGGAGGGKGGGGRGADGGKGGGGKGADCGKGGGRLPVPPELLQNNYDSG